jgi:NitT/TauT family transport system substrate-binding protein
LSSRRSFVATGAVFGAAAALRPATTFAQSEQVLRIGISAVEQNAQALYADELGLFKNAGLNVDIVVNRNGGVTMAAIIGGSLDIGCANLMSLGLAFARNVPLEILVPAGIWDSSRPNAYTIVAPDSPIKTARDLNGKTVGTGTLNSTDQLFMVAFIQKGGGDPASVKFVEVPTSSVADMLAQGRIAAYTLAEPFFSAAGNRVRAIGTAPDAIAPRFAEAAWFSSASWLTQNKPVARRFVDATIAAGAWAMANPEAAARILEKRLGVKEPRGVGIFAASADPLLVQVLFDRAAEFKMLGPLHASDFFWNGK